MDLGYAAMAALVLVGMAAAFMAKEPREKEREAEAEALGERHRQSAEALLPRRLRRLRRFPRSRRTRWLILLFVIFYKLTEPSPA